MCEKEDRQPKNDILVEACDIVGCVVHDSVVYGHDPTKLLIIDKFESRIVHVVHENMLHVSNVLFFDLALSYLLSAQGALVLGWAFCVSPAFPLAHGAVVPPTVGGGAGVLLAQGAFVG